MSDIFSITQVGHKHCGQITCTKEMCDKLIVKMETYTKKYGITSVAIHKEETCASLGYDDKFGKVMHQGPYIGTRWRKEKAGAMEDKDPLELILSVNLFGFGPTDDWGGSTTVHLVHNDKCMQLTGAMLADAQVDAAIAKKLKERDMNLQMGGCKAAGFDKEIYHK